MAGTNSKSAIERMDSTPDYRPEESDAKEDVHVDTKVASVLDNSPPLSHLERDPNDPLVSLVFSTFGHRWHNAILSILSNPPSSTGPRGRNG